MAVARNEPVIEDPGRDFGKLPTNGQDSPLQREVQRLQAERLASLCRLTAGLAHEINNPIAFVGSNLRTLKRYIGDLLEILAAYEELEAGLEKGGVLSARIAILKNKLDLPYLRQDAPVLVEESLDGIRRVSCIVQDMLDFSHDGGCEWQMADLRHCLDSTLKVFCGRIGKEIELVRDYGDLPEILCQPAQLNQVFMDLLMNAAEAIDKAGTITVRAAQIGEEVRVEVADSGQGIQPELLSRIFDPFFSTKEIGKGLGLSRAYGLVSANHGHIDVWSEPGKGSCFRITLPVWHPESEGAGAPGPQSCGANTRDAMPGNACLCAGNRHELQWQS